MGTVHKLLEEKGKQGVLALGMLERAEVEAAATYMADEDAAIGFLYSGWCFASLPHRKLPDSEIWQVRGDRLTLLVEPGVRVHAEGPPTPVGVPYGSRARLILLYLQSEAIRTNSREVELGRSLSVWLGRMGIPTGGKSFSSVRNQAERIARCRFSFHMTSGGAAGLVNQNVMDTALFLEPNEAKGSKFLERAKLSESFYQRLRDHPVPLEDSAVRALSNNSMALDCYTWLAYRLRALLGRTPITFKALCAQFGAGFSRSDNFRTHFTASMRLALAVYPAAKVEFEDAGLVLRPSPPPVPERAAAALR
jgi:hypothetical protein